MSPRRMRMTSPGTSSRAAGVIHFPSRFTRALMASLAFRAAMALPAWRSSQNPTTALARSRTRMMPEVRPMPGYRRKDDRCFDHPRDGTPEIGKKLQERIGLLLFNLVRPVLGQPFLRLGLAESVRRRPQPGLQFRHGKGLRIVLRISLRYRGRSRSPGLVGTGVHFRWPHLQFRISGMSWPYVSMYCLCSISLSLSCCFR